MTEAVTRGDVVHSVITTGAVNPVVTVQVGTYVSGVVQALYCDYNTPVKAGQLCAKIDPRPFQVVVDQSVANLASARAQLRKDQAAVAFSKVEYERDLKLAKHGGVSQETVDTDKSNLDQNSAQVGLDEATVQQHQAILDAAQVNLDYTNIISPVDGIVVSRSIDVGQTVAASFQTPTLFLIAKDLTKMQVDTNVSESDVGAVKVGQKASFTVESYPSRVFWGQVAQLRQAPITVQNVVTYDVVVSVDNPDLLLLPGMTANTRIITDERRAVLRVPVAALRFSPHGLGYAAGQERASQSGSAAAETTPHKHGAETRVWVLRAGRPQPVPVTVGLSDGTVAEISSGDLKVGDEVVVNAIQAAGKRSGAPGRPPLRF
ncbi:MAG TPA: efflux RND transporter periplasmic adaptor subunit [Candidatus Margulisiibacteriota bacterium]|nr:efflux RND transporter periplasmic adaptor subunit [Candidatus Margulisiibacteriota bacterium]